MLLQRAAEAEPCWSLRYGKWSVRQVGLLKHDIGNGNTRHATGGWIAALQLLVGDIGAGHGATAQEARQPHQRQPQQLFMRLEPLAPPGRRRGRRPYER